MTEYNSFNFDQSPWSFASAQQSPPFPPYGADGLGLLDQNPGAPSNPPWTTWFPPSTSSVDPSGPNPVTVTAATEDATVDEHEQHSRPRDQSPTSGSGNSFIPPPSLQQQQQQQRSPFQTETEARNALKNLVDSNQQHASASASASSRLAGPSAFDLHSPTTATTGSPRDAPPPSQSQSHTPVPPLQSSIALHSFLNGFNPSGSPNPYALPPQISQDDYIRLLKQAAAQQHANNSMFPLLNTSAPSPSQQQRPSSSSSSTQSHHHQQQQRAMYGQASTSLGSTTFSLPPPAQFNTNQQPQQQAGGATGHHSRPHERTPSTSSSIRTSSNDRVGGGSVLDSPRGSYPTYPSPQQTLSLHSHHSNPYLSHLTGGGAQSSQSSQSSSAANAASANNVIGGEGYNPSEPYIALSLPPPSQHSQQHSHQFPAHLLAAGGPSTASASNPSPSSYPGSPLASGSGAAAAAAALGFCPPAPGPAGNLRPPVSPSTPGQVPAPTTMRNLQQQQQALMNAGAMMDEKGKGKMVLDDAMVIGGGFVPPKPSSSNGGRATSITSSNGDSRGGVGSSRKRAHNDEDDEDQSSDEDEDEDDDGDGGSSAFTRQPVASTSANGGSGGGGGGSRQTSIILPNSIDPITGQLRRQTEVPAVEDDPSVRPYGCNYCYLDRTVDPAIRAYWEQQESLHDGYKVSWRTVKELREHNQREHRERTEKLKEHEQLVKDEGGVQNGKGPDLPFRCALEPCGKTFKSLAGLRFHFQNASANGHFFVTLEKDQKTGEERATKKFKQEVQPNGRELSCPVERCPKRFKQSAGLAYHLSHTPNHEVTEALISTFESTLQSKTRWWFRKLGLEFAQ
ncbi:hypothetical protein JCM3766R1_001901 [Sporobolomyces carnicolor]